MQGVYFHIPYCKQACHYCDFHFSTVLNTRDELVSSMVRETSDRLGRTPKPEVSTVYFGGGTPSLLTGDELAKLLEILAATANVAHDAEITLEANPDDLSAANLAMWKAAGINRLSVGIQSFHDRDLKWMNRAHNSDEARQAVDRARAAGFERLTLDVIYGLPEWSGDEWRQNLDHLLALEVDHFSAYILTVEEKTALGKAVASNRQRVTDDAEIEAQYTLLCERAQAAGYQHYEVSNFCLNGRMSQHNSAYWTGMNYLGIGPGAHSFDGHSRRWNIASNPQYIKRIGAGEAYWEEEHLQPTDRHNERLLTGLRTARGIDLDDFVECGSPAEHPDTAAIWRGLINEGAIEAFSATRFRIPESRWLFADRIAGDLFLV